VRRAYLGVDVPQPGDYTLAVAQSLGLDAPRGALVKAVKDGSPAAEAGLRPRDVALQYDGVRLDDEDHLINLVARTEIGRTVAVHIWRNGEQRVLHIKLVERPAGK
jgi:serine protease Do